ncbi:Rnf-Nqr domain containing protein [Pseudomonas sp. CCC2.2]|uniref:Rnf-Nqr domain containing protein n=1 Tax=Pseudomonas sp. CCC2.2 TaxID=3048605 RepID=UPI002B2258E2|nr:Rnf-Nqr domain containing protein [Pseudomonas sp. CCC2.2]MEB0146362.1 Rnf-Nqr domain containing protein [Pseudomonas sp. CCC2.2]
MSERAQHNNDFSPLLGPLSLTPLLGITDSLVRAMGLLLVLWIVGGLHNVLVRWMRPLLNPGSHLLASTLVAAALVSCAELVLQAQALALYQGLGIYLALIGTHCVLSEYTGEATDDRPRNYPKPIVLFSVLMLSLGLLRELLGNGTLLSHAQWLFGASAAYWEVSIFSGGLHLALLTPGGFILLGLLLAARNVWASSSSPIRTPDAKNIDRLSASKETLQP